ncbi:MAG: cardiolipin synthase, partial [Verrucomicrobiae bacterium]|nr:cardiolipin synthase [Verrucomicrobiae bacterium]
MILPEVMLGLLHLCSLFFAVHAVMYSRSPQGAIGWAVSLLIIPLVALPAYLLLGRSKFVGYAKAGSGLALPLDDALQTCHRVLEPWQSPLPGSWPQLHRLNAQLHELQSTRSNDIRLLIDGAATFDAIFEAIQHARQTILVQFYIVRDDRIGRELRSRLIQKAAEGVRVYFLYDRIGSHGLPHTFLRTMETAGIQTAAFGSSRHLINPFQINFRNHRKLVIIDGATAFTGGLNVGDEYLGKNPRFGPWRDTHVKITGPSALDLQICFLEDWFWATGQTPALPWSPAPAREADQLVYTLKSGPADELEVCALLLIDAIASARKRFWVASPYFVPDHGILSTLQLAALRGVDVRILLPGMPDHLLPYLTSYTYYPSLRKAGVKVFRMKEGFMHQKVALIDDSLASVGTVNMDYRSLLLNFELTVFSPDRAFCMEVEAMLREDFSRSHP